MDGVKLLLLFAFGALKDGVCGTPAFTKKVGKYLEGDELFEREIIEEIPKQLNTAWLNLMIIADEMKTGPLSLKTVSEYVFHRHNLIAPLKCQVTRGEVLRIGRNVINIKTRNGLDRIRFLHPFAEDIKFGDSVLFHRKWLIEKETSKNKFSALNK